MSGPFEGAGITLDESNADLIRSGVAIDMASVDAGHATSLTRGFGCRVSADRRRVTVFVVASYSAEVLDDLRLTRRVAVVFCNVISNRSVQLKGTDAVIGPLLPGDLERVEAYRDAFVAETGKEGYPEVLMRAHVDIDPQDLVAIEFSLSAAFVATPGLDAGAPLRTSA